MDVIAEHEVVNETRSSYIRQTEARFVVRSEPT